LTPLWTKCTVAAPSLLSPSVWRDKERRKVNKKPCPSIKNGAAAHPSDSSRPGHPIGPSHPPHRPLGPIKAPLWAPLCPNRPTHFSSGYKASERHSSSQTPHYTPATSPSHPQSSCVASCSETEKGRRKHPIVLRGRRPHHALSGPSLPPLSA
jgi:hypothetical protein